MRLTDVCHPIELRAPAPRVFPTPHATFAAGMTHGVQGSMRLFGGPDVSRRPRPLRRIVIRRGFLVLTFWSHERGRLLPTAPDATEPLTPLSRATVHPRASPTFVEAATLPYVPRVEGLYGSEDAADRRDHRPRRFVKSVAS